MIWLLANWRMAAAGVAIGAGLLWGVTGWWRYTDLKAVVAQERVDAARLGAKMEAEARDKDNRNAELARNLDAERERAAADAAAGRDDFSRQLADRLRAERARCRNVVPVAADSSGAAASAATGGDGTDRRVAIGVRIRDAVKSLQADVRECVAFANGIGR